MSFDEGHPTEEPTFEEPPALSEVDQFAEYLDSEEDNPEGLADEAVEYDEADLIEEAPDVPETYTVKVAGQELEVTLDDLKNGFSRTQDYTRKTMELAEERKAIQAEKARLQQELAQVHAAMQSIQNPVSEEPEPDWNALYEQDPIEWIRQRELWRDKKEQQAQQAAQRQHLMELQQQQQVQQMQEMLHTQTQILSETIPEWRDQERARQEKQLIRQWGLQNGYLENELAQVYDARAVQTMRKAMLYDRLTEKRKTLKPVQGRTMPAGTGNRQEPQQLRMGKRAARLHQTGSIDDATAFFEEYLRAEG